ncbi:MAG: TetR/AcrR family transcriptional regulator [Deltaproteobacteria bacterium]|nr:TetR/AcrR family transcriptional regulator [Deltaproteobacteria bacterium]
MSTAKTTRKPTRRSAQKTETRRRILDAASALFLRQGFGATGVDGVMAEAGLTAGGFYAHFRSKTHLLAEALRHSFENGMTTRAFSAENRSSEERIRAFIDLYVSPTHRDQPELGCPLVGLAAELGRESAEVRRIVAAYLESAIHAVAGSRHRKKALAALATMVGAVLLSRITRGTPLSDEILAAARGSLKSDM